MNSSEKSSDTVGLPIKEQTLPDKGGSVVISQPKKKRIKPIKDVCTVPGYEWATLKKLQKWRFYS